MPKRKRPAARRLLTTDVVLTEQQTIRTVKRELVGLKRFVVVELAKRGWTHADAAGLAGVTPARWSNILNKRAMSPVEFAHLARGLGISPDELAAACRRKRGGQ